MVRALLNGTKTQTRRVVKPQPPADCGGLLVDAIYPVVIDRHGDDQPGAEKYGVTTNDGEWCLPCPYGQPGDRLWVKETHWRDDEDGSILYAANPDDAALVDLNKHESGLAKYNWKPSIFMRREYSRILLEIVSVRVERLQEISAADATAEGMTPKLRSDLGWASHEPSAEGFMLNEARHTYLKLWEAINGPGSWAANPWVWAVEFKRVAQ